MARIRPMVPVLILLSSVEPASAAECGACFVECHGTVTVDVHTVEELAPRHFSA